MSYEEPVTMFLILLTFAVGWLCGAVTGFLEG